MKNTLIGSIILVLAIVVFGLSAAPAAAADKIVIKIAQNSGIYNPMQVGAEKFKQVMESETNGAVEVQIFPDAAMGTEVKTIQMVKLGTLDATIVATASITEFAFECGIFDLPFVFRDMEHMFEVVDGPFGQRFAKLIEEKTGSVFLGYASFGSRNAYNAKRPVLKPDDLKGLKIRVMGTPILIDTFNALGAQATTLAWGELYSALQQGVVDGGECDPVDMWDMKFHEVTKYVSFTEHLVGVRGYLFSKKVYDKLPANVQAVLFKAGREAVLADRNSQREKVGEAMEKIKKTGIVTFYKVDKQPFIDQVHSVYEKNADKVGGMDLIELISKWH
jgi:tripartite ATP-independent transporter DctP family solute receptor